MQVDYYLKKIIHTCACTQPHYSFPNWPRWSKLYSAWEMYWTPCVSHTLASLKQYLCVKRKDVCQGSSQASALNMSTEAERLFTKMRTGGHLPVEQRGREGERVAAKHAEGCGPSWWKPAGTLREDWAKAYGGGGLDCDVTADLGIANSQFHAFYELWLSGK